MTAMLRLFSKKKIPKVFFGQDRLLRNSHTRLMCVKHGHNICEKKRCFHGKKFTPLHLCVAINKFCGVFLTFFIHICVRVRVYNTLDLDYSQHQSVQSTYKNDTVNASEKHLPIPLCISHIYLRCLIQFSHSHIYIYIYIYIGLYKI